MSIDIDWHGLTTGPEGLALAESIRDFIHEKFQSVQLPRFIRSVEVHSFEFGDEAPVVELKDIGDPLEEFYDAEKNEDGSEDDGGGEEGEGGQENELRGEGRDLRKDSYPATSHFQRHDNFKQRQPAPPLIRPIPIDSRFRPDLSRSSTPGIPGGTSNLSYFHLPLSAGLSGTSTPLAAVASGNNAGWSDMNIASLHGHPPFGHVRQHSPVRQTPLQAHVYEDPLTRPSTSSTSYPYNNSTNDNAPAAHDTNPSRSHSTTPPSAKTKTKIPKEKQKHIPSSPTDLQIALHISYSGPLHLSMTAEILLDYPMPSFVGIPLKLNITGLAFDGLALVAYLQNNRACFCFLEDEGVGAGKSVGIGGGGGLLRDIKVESEIGRQEGGKQVLRNVGKVEKFVLEQVRRIFEEEFVWPSFWTVLV
ncbi:MAG: hypothetical protein Q9178_000049 [Gyalolechia marmorata]